MNTHVYFVRSTRSRAVKIGCSDNVEKRIAELQTATSQRLVVMAQVPGDERYEKWLHKQFASLRIRGEWFRLEGDLAKLIALLPILEQTRPAPPARARRHSAAMDPPPSIDRRITNMIEDELRAAVRSIGVTEFLAVVNGTRRQRGYLVRWLGDKSRSLRLDWAMYLGAVDKSGHGEKALRIMCQALGFELMTPEETQARKASEAETELRYQRMVAAVIGAHGEEKGRAMLAEAERRVDEECLAIMRKQWTDPNYFGPTEAQLQWRHRRYGDPLPYGLQPWPSPVGVAS